MARQREQIGREHRGPHIRVEGGGALPDAAREAEDALEERDGTLNAGAKVAELPIDPTALHHVEHGESPFLGEADVAPRERVGVSITPTYLTAARTPSPNARLFSTPSTPGIGFQDGH